MTAKSRISTRVATLILSIIMLFGGAVECNAMVNNTISPYYVNIERKTASLSISGITANCKATLTVDSSTNLSITMELQKQKSSGYETVKTWTSSKTGKSLNLEKSKTINALSTYRLKVTFVAGNDTYVEYKYPS